MAWLSPGRVQTVRARPTSRAPCHGARMPASSMPMRSRASPMLATASVPKAATRSSIGASAASAMLLVQFRGSPGHDRTLPQGADQIGGGGGLGRAPRGVLDRAVVQPVQRGLPAAELVGDLLPHPVSAPAARPAAPASTISAPRPFMKVLRSSLRAEASPGAPPMSSTGAPSAPNTWAACSEPAPLITTLVAAPCAGTEPTTDTSANRCAPTASAIWRFTAGSPAFMSAKTAPSARNGATAPAAAAAAFPPTRLSTASAPRTASSEHSPPGRRRRASHCRPGRNP